MVPDRFSKQSFKILQKHRKFPQTVLQNGRFPKLFWINSFFFSAFFVSELFFLPFTLQGKNISSLCVVNLLRVVFWVRRGNLGSFSGTPRISRQTSREIPPMYVIPGFWGTYQRPKIAIAKRCVFTSRIANRNSHHKIRKKIADKSRNAIAYRCVSKSQVPNRNV